MADRLKKWWQRLSSTAFGRWLFSQILGWLIPYTGTIKPLVLELRPRLALVRIKDRHKKRNHLNSLHALALANLGELTTGLCLHFALKNGDQAILTRLEIDYHKKARGSITAKSELLGEKLDCTVVLTARLCDQSGELVASVNASWLIRHSR